MYGCGKSLSYFTRRVEDVLVNETERWFIKKKAIIIGAGIGGLCTAIALQNGGWEVTVFEKATSFSEVGAGIVLAPNAIHALDKLGLAKDVCNHGAPVEKAEIKTWNGNLIVDLPTTDQANRYGTHSYLIHRALLQSILLDHLKANTNVKLNKKLIKIEQNEQKVTAHFTDGTHEYGDMLVGADGTNSAVRELLFGNVKPKYAGYTALRGICEMKDSQFIMEKGGGFEAWGPGKRFGFSKIGQGKVFWFAAINSPQGVSITSGERKNVALHHLRGWIEPIESVIKATEESAILHHDIFDRYPLTRWSNGRITLLGDAAHPMLPNLGQGGAQAMEDAIVLAQCLRENSSLEQTPDSLLSYESKRIQRTVRIVQQSRRMGWMVQLENPILIAARNAMLKSIPKRLLMEQMNWVVGYKV